RQTPGGSRDSSTKGSTKSLGMLAQTFGKPAVSTAHHGARTLWGKLFSRTWKNMLPEQTSAGRASGVEAGSQLKSQGKWLGVGGTFLWDFTYLCWNLTITRVREFMGPPPTAS